MGMHATGTIEMKSWDEQPYAELEGAPKLSRASGSDLYHGGIEGEATFEYLIMYRADGSASTVGLERVVGRLDRRSGSFVVILNGAFSAGTVKATLSVASGSGTGELRVLQSHGTLLYQRGQSLSLTLDYDFG
jgi:hypothetical protein